MREKTSSLWRLLLSLTTPPLLPLLLNPDLGVSWMLVRKKMVMILQQRNLTTLVPCILSVLLL